MTYRIPPPSLRPCGQYCVKEDDYRRTGREEVARLEAWGFNDQSEVLEIGCGAGRFALALRERFPRLKRYVGLDVSQEAIAWCEQEIKSPEFLFVHLDLANERFNPNGTIQITTGTSGWRLPLRDASFDFAYAYAVFPHMHEYEIAWYARECARLLRPDGVMFATFHVEHGVPNKSINPAGYPEPHHRANRDALHAVRYEWDYLTGLLANAGLRIAGVTHESWRKQTGLFLRRIK